MCTWQQASINMGTEIPLLTKKVFDHHSSRGGVTMSMQMSISKKACVATAWIDKDMHEQTTHAAFTALQRLADDSELT